MNVPKPPPSLCKRKVPAPMKPMAAVNEGFTFEIPPPRRINYGWSGYGHGLVKRKHDALEICDQIIEMCETALEYDPLYRPLIFSSQD